MALSVTKSYLLYFLGACFLISVYLGIKTLTMSNRTKMIKKKVVPDSHRSYRRFAAWNFRNASAFLPTFVDSKDINTEISNFVQIKRNETKDNFVNLHSYNFTLNSQKCKFGTTFLIIVVHTAPKHFKERNRIRSTYGSVDIYRLKNIATVFMVGSVKEKATQNSLNKESAKYGDIVQGNFVDEYTNLIKKHIMALHWYTHYCNSTYILKLDDDAFINPYRMIDYLIDTKPSGRGILCKIAERYAPIREPKAKYYTPPDQYPFKLFPDFCVGYAYLTTPETWHGLYEASRTTRAMNMDDVYVTGILPVRIKVPKFDFSDILLPCIHASKFNIEELKEKPFICYLYGNTAFKHWTDVEREQ